MRRRRLKKLVKRFHELRQQKLSRDHLLIKLGHQKRDWHEEYAGEGKRNASTAVRKLARGWN